MDGIGDSDANSIGPKLNRNGLHTIADLKNLTEQRMGELAGLKLGRGMSLHKFRQYQAAASTVENNAPTDMVKDYRKDENPYLARFGPDLWEEEIDRSITLRSSICITHLIVHMWAETAKAMKGTMHEDDWLIYHDALKLMTAKRTIDWMKTTTAPDGTKYFDRWILPELGCNADIRNFEGRPVGDIPEGQPMDCSLNNDLKKAIMAHIVDTRLLPEDDHRKFSISTPKRCSEALGRIWNFGLLPQNPEEDQHQGGVPNGRRIVQDCERTLDSYRRIDEAHGGFVVGLGNQQGRRAEQRRATGVRAPRGGKRIKMSAEEQLTKLCRWRHPIIAGLTSSGMQQSIAIHEQGVNNGVSIVVDESSNGSDNSQQQQE